MIRSKRVLSMVCAASLLFTWHGASAADRSNAFTIQDALRVKYMTSRTPISLSPDGEWVAYTVRDDTRVEGGTEGHIHYTLTGAPRETDGCDIWIANTGTNEVRNLTQSKGTSSNPSWSPDGKFLAFYSDRSGQERIWLWERASGSLRQLSDAVPRPSFGFEGLRWTPDGRHLLAKVLPEGMTPEQALHRVANVKSTPALEEASDREVVYTSRPSVATKESASKGLTEAPDKQYFGDLVLIDVLDGQIERLVQDVDVHSYLIAPNGKYIAMTDFLGFDPNTQYPEYRLSAYFFASHELRVLVPRIRQSYGASLSISPNSNWLAYTTSNHGDCYVIEAEGGEPKNVTPGDHPSFDERLRAPVWDPDEKFIYLTSSEADERSASDAVWMASVEGRPLERKAEIVGHQVLQIVTRAWDRQFYSPDGRSLVVLTRDQATKKNGFFKVDLETGRPTLLLEEPGHFGDSVYFLTDSTKDSRVLVYAAEDERHPQDLWVATRDFTKQKRITNTNPQISSAGLGQSEVIEWRSVDGELLRGGLLLPAGYQQGKRYPLVVEVYAGARPSEDAYRFGLGGGDANRQILATRGYAVLLPDIPLRRDSATPMLDILKMVMPAVDRTVDLGVADSDRIGLMGYSYGGYTTLSLVVQTTRFKAAVEGGAIADLVSFYGDLEPGGYGGGIGYLETGQGRMGGTPWQFRDKYIENSPIFYLDRVQTPLLITQGALDASWKQEDEVFIDLRRLGKEVTYVKYKNQGHADWNPSTSKDNWDRIIGWFDEHLVAQPAVGEPSH